MTFPYAPLMQDGFIQFATHAFDPRTESCVREREGKLCGRHINDVLSGTEDVKPGMEGISCYGLTTPFECEQINKARKLRAESIERAMG